MRGILRFLKWGAVLVIVAFVGLWGMIFYSMSDTALISSGQGAVRDRLTDPESARFRNMFVISARGRTIVCGEVNAKNPMGGMSGFKAFAYLLRENDVLIAGEQGLSFHAVQSACSGTD